MILAPALMAPAALPGCAARQETAAPPRATPPAKEVSQQSPAPSQSGDETPSEGGVIGGTVGGYIGDTVSGDNSLDFVLPFGAGMTRPEKRSGPSVAYTQEALAARAQGLMIVKCLLTEEGTVAHCRVIKPIAHMADAVLMSLYQSRYQPATYGKPLAVDYTFNVRLQLPGTPSDLASPAWLAAQAEEELRLKARFLCAHDLFEAPVPSRLPQGVDAASLIRHEDLDFALRNPSRVPRTEFDTPNLHAYLAPYVSCEPTEVRVSGDTATVSVKRDAPSWEDLPTEEPVALEADMPVMQRLYGVARFVRAPGTVRHASTHQLQFVRTSQSWRAHYGLAEGSAGASGSRR